MYRLFKFYRQRRSYLVHVRDQCSRLRLDASVIIWETRIIDLLKLITTIFVLQDGLVKLKYGC